MVEWPLVWGVTVDLTGGAILANNGVIDANGCLSVGGCASQYQPTGEMLAGLGLVSTPENPRFMPLTAYGDSCVPLHFNTAAWVSGAPATPPTGTIVMDIAARPYYGGSFSTSLGVFQMKTLAAVGGSYPGCMAYIQLAASGGARNDTLQSYPSGDLIQPLPGSRHIVGASSMSGMSNHSGIITGLTTDVGNIGWAMGHSTSQVSVYIGVTSNMGFNYANATIYAGKDANTGRTGNGAGTWNGTGSDVAEYKLKAADCGIIAKGDVLGRNAQGAATDKWKDAVTFWVKSTDPYLVGGDTWGTEAAIGVHKSHPSFPERHEKARARVDRLSYCGDVPVNVMRAKPGQYIVPVRDGEGIKGRAVGHIAVMLYRLINLPPVGRVVSILADGRAEIAVM